MSDPRGLTNEALLSSTLELARAERALTLRILHHLAEIERRRLFASLGYPSLFEYSVRHLGYNEASAQRRIASMRLMREIPEIEAKLESGELSLSSVAQAQVFFRREAKVAPFPLEEKKRILRELEGKSTRECERALLAMSAQPELRLKERVRPGSPTHMEMTFFADAGLTGLLEQIRGFLAHQLQDPSLSEVIHHIAREYWERRNPAREVRGNGNRVQQSVTAQQVSRYITARVRREVFRRDDGRCSFVDAASGRRCNSRYRLQLDHYPQPFGRGGPSTLDNLRLVCSQHNVLHAIQSYGLATVEAYDRPP